MKTFTRATPTGKEVLFDEEEIIVSKTDTTGKITYANEVFYKVTGFTEEEVINMPHSIIRHPAMPRIVFKVLWDTIQSGNEIFAYVINMAKNGDHYWVFAHVTPTYSADGVITGYHSSRRVARRDKIEQFEGIYKLLLAEEKKYSDKQKAMEASGKLLVRTLEQHKISYEELVFMGAD